MSPIGFITLWNRILIALIIFHDFELSIARTIRPRSTYTTHNIGISHTQSLVWRADRLYPSSKDLRLSPRCGDDPYPKVAMLVLMLRPLSTSRNEALIGSPHLL